MAWFRRRASRDKCYPKRPHELSDAGTRSESLLRHPKKECSLLPTEFVVVWVGEKVYSLRVRAEITSQFWRSDLCQIWSRTIERNRRRSRAYVEDFVIEERPKMVRRGDAKMGSYFCASPKAKLPCSRPRPYPGRDFIRRARVGARVGTAAWRPPPRRTPS